ncbi:Glycosyl transferase family 2 [Acetitomaculum ruminis DSM 5522]|uniref:Glycosyl transferase family 2 n=1 Tax=Acetitomaculum ruminis DSM 5522 TaxID=1120918 RepID=A0A1I0Z4G8_9FIRM|nr:glycosyltransferase [Acetitomaculum ruminis]SFB19338.1 Glycosyl transferase family 2 [Acetitomaculum ruminis DSM 5522]
MFKDKEDLISIIIPVYNVEKYLSFCLESIIKQTYKNLEIICIDDGSFDTSGKICDDYAKKDSRIVVYHIENGGVSRARNFALKKIKGKWFSFVDADDWLEPDFYQTLLTNAIKYESEISACLFQRNTQFQMGKTDNKNYVITLDSSKECIHNFICHGFSLMGQVWNKLYLSEKFKHINFVEDIKVNEDCLYTFDVMSACNKACLCSDRLYHWFLRDDSACHTKNIQCDFTAANVFLQLMELTKTYNDKDVEDVLMENYIKSSLKVLLHAHYKKNNEDVLEAKIKCKKFKKRIWNNLDNKTKIKFILCIYLK